MTLNTGAKAPPETLTVKNGGVNGTPGKNTGAVEDLMSLWEQDDVLKWSLLPNPGGGYRLEAETWPSLEKLVIEKNDDGDRDKYPWVLWEGDLMLGRYGTLDEAMRCAENCHCDRLDGPEPDEVSVELSEAVEELADDYQDWLENLALPREVLQHYREKIDRKVNTITDAFDDDDEVVYRIDRVLPFTRFPKKDEHEEGTA